MEIADQSGFDYQNCNFFNGDFHLPPTTFPTDDPIYWLF